MHPLNQKLLYLSLYFFVYTVQSTVFNITVNRSHSLVQSQSDNSNFTLPRPTAWHFAVIYDNSLFIIDAIHESTIHSIQLSFNHNQWIERPQISFFTNNNGHESTISIQNQLYLINVWSDLYPGRTLLLYDLVSNAIHPLPDLPIALIETCTVYNAINRIIYVIGGQDSITNNNYDTTQRFNTTSNTWITAGSTTFNAIAYAGCSLNTNSTYIYQFGGNDGGVDVQNIERYDTTNDIWTRIIARLTEARSRLKCRLLSTDDLIYCIGGITADNYASDIVDIFDPQSETILAPITLNTARFVFTATLWNNDECIIICGGYNGYLDSSPYYLDTVESIGDCPLFDPYFITTETQKTTLFVSTVTESDLDPTISSEIQKPTLFVSRETESGKMSNITLNPSNSVKGILTSNNIVTLGSVKIERKADNKNKTIWIIFGCVFGVILVGYVVVGVGWFRFYKGQQKQTKMLKTLEDGEEKQKNDIEVNDIEENHIEEKQRIDIIMPDVNPQIKQKRSDSEALYIQQPNNNTTKTEGNANQNDNMMIGEADIVVLDDFEEDNDSSVSSGLYNNENEVYIIKNTTMGSTKDLNEKANGYDDEGYDLDIDYRIWNSTQIVYWIINVNSDIFSEYEEILTVKLNEEEINGDYLCNTNASDINRWGITNLDHIQELMKHIKTLVQNEETDKERYKSTVGYI